MSCIILAAGDFPAAPESLAALKAAEYICCCDSAAKSLLAWGREPDAIVGDGDSVDDEIIKKYSDRWHWVAEQEDNDLTKATRFCMAQGFTHITYLGATGKREDHTIGNIFLIARYMRDFHIEPVMISDYGVFTPAKGKTTFPSFPGQQVSIFLPFGNDMQMKSEGLRWESYPYTEMWQGTLNESLGDSFTLEGDKEYVVFQTHRKKQKSRF